ncbi:hexosaminidase subunit [Seminavis robusta]|uniref:Beta-hexosaminidase n=1 Tax=Seminavis robusta TaxID=568900 RepID=A0A9N8HQ54_9STRA|nr:hexosaminidase subunit [Seminavis robusta]|eukprot:Sro1251_g256160.1 hexosaminidase subunit (594) ;mRNA; f:11524-13305
MKTPMRIPSRLLLVALHLLLLLATTIQASLPRLFPAAKQERYDPQARLLCTVLGHPSLFSTLRHPLVVGTTSTTGSTDHDDDHPILEAAKKRFLEYLQQLPDYAEEYPVNPHKQELKPIKSIKLVVRDTANNATYHHVPANVDESYQIQIDCNTGDQHRVLVQSRTVFGMVRALESLAQLVAFGWMDTSSSSSTDPVGSSSDGKAVFVIRNTPLFVADKPTFSYRGLMIDTARHYLPLDLILSNLDVMSMNKLNVLHWHMTDDQSWPFQSTTYPEISEKGAYDPKHNVYSHDDVQQVLDAALLHGIRVIPEFDLPGHSAAVGRSHPELMSSCGDDKKYSFSAPLDPTKPQVYQFVENIYKEVAALFPDPFMHVGGDEVRLDCWKASKSIQRWAKVHGHMTEKELLNYFESILTDIVASNGKTPIAWQELLNEGVDLPPGTIIDVWKGFDKDTIINATKRNYPVIISGCWYLDHLQDKWKDYYKCDPLDFNGTKAQKDLVMGGHASMWGERVDPTDFTARVWPRASAVAERLWSGNDPRKSLQQTVEQRLTNFRCFMVQRGVSAAPIGPGTCGRRQEQQDGTKLLFLRSRQADG